MNYEEFKEQLQNDLPNVLPKHLKDVEIDLQENDKLQTGTYQAMVVRKKESVIGLCINLDDYFLSYRMGKTYDECLARIGEIIADNISSIPMIDVKMLDDYEKLKHMLSIQLIPTNKNLEILTTIPHKKLEDSSMVYRFVVSNGEVGVQSILINNKMLERYGITEE